jgi:rod shape determining protein RodA
VVAMLFWHVFINIGMVLGMMPVVGIPLPLLSYGGSFIISTLIGVGLLLNVSMRRYLF